VRPQGVLWFGAAQALEDRLLADLAARPSIERMVIHLDGVGRLDITAAQTLHTVLDEARRGGVEVDVDGVRDEDRRLVDGVVLAPGKLSA
jgi:SulP family sulfate permease